MEPLEQIVLTVQAGIERARRRAVLLGAGLFAAGLVSGVVLVLAARGA